MLIPEIIANRFYTFFEKELYDFTFTFKTEASIGNNQTIMSLCEAAVCAAHDIEYDDYINETTSVSYDEIFGDSANMTEQVVNIMLAKFAEQHNGS